MVVEFTEILKPLENAIYWTLQGGCTRLEIGYLNGLAAMHGYCSLTSIHSSWL